MTPSSTASQLDGRRQNRPPGARNGFSSVISRRRWLLTRPGHSLETQMSRSTSSAGLPALPSSFFHRPWRHHRQGRLILMDPASVMIIRALRKNDLRRGGKERCRGVPDHTCPYRPRQRPCNGRWNSIFVSVALQNDMKSGHLGTRPDG